MTLRNKIIAGLTSLGIAGGSAVVGLDQACVFDAVILKVDTEKICFSAQKDYKKFKDEKIALYQSKPPLFLWTEEGVEFLAVVNYEIEKLKDKKVKVKDFSKNKNILDEVISQISSNP